MLSMVVALSVSLTRGGVSLSQRCLMHSAPPGTVENGDNMGVGDGRLFRRLRPTSKQTPVGPATAGGENAASL